MLDIRVRMVMGHLVVSFWCNSHGGHPHCLWNASQEAGAGGPEEFAERVMYAAREFARRVVQDELDELTGDCLT